ncbi:MAG: radical SAM protein, partial [Treponemataceae bacterium]|nr:radical SAM protein [Treponemataceae bacterium]
MSDSRSLELFNNYKSCTLCPRNCGVNRLEGELGFCRETADLRIATATIHFGEEPPITVLGGSGTIFITGCNLRCAFCQNYQISQNGMGKIVDIEEFADICLKLQDEKAENINIVTGSHVIPSLAEGLERAKAKGLKIPVCWNSSAYESVEALEMLDGLVDIWLPDMKTLNPLISDSVFKASDYPSTCKKAIRWMINHAPLKFENVKEVHDEKSKKRFGGETIEKMLSGVIVRHLVLPGRINDTVMVLDWLKDHVDGRACISIMSQYTPVKFDEAEMNRRKPALD